MGAHARALTLSLMNPLIPRLPKPLEHVNRCYGRSAASRTMIDTDAGRWGNVRWFAVRYAITQRV